MLARVSIWPFFTHSILIQPFCVLESQSALLREFSKNRTSFSCTSFFLPKYRRPLPLFLALINWSTIGIGRLKEKTASGFGILKVPYSICASHLIKALRFLVFAIFPPW